LLMVLSLLFSQLALANYVCPKQADQRAGMQADLQAELQANLQAMAARMAAGAPCEGMDADQPVLCHQYAADAAKTFEIAKLPNVLAPALIHVFELPLVLEMTAAGAMPQAAMSPARPPPEPLFLSTLRLRV
jgi:hypothetical protein